MYILGCIPILLKSLHFYPLHQAMSLSWCCWGLPRSLGDIFSDGWVGNWKQMMVYSIYIFFQRYFEPICGEDSYFWLRYFYHRWLEDQVVLCYFLFFGVVDFTSSFRLYLPDLEVTPPTPTRSFGPKVTWIADWLVQLYLRCYVVICSALFSKNVRVTTAAKRGLFLGFWCDLDVAL